MKIDIGSIYAHCNLPLLAIEHTGWRRWVYGRWVYKSEPFRVDIQRKIAKSGPIYHLSVGERAFDPDDA